MSEREQIRNQEPTSEQAAVRVNDQLDGFLALPLIIWWGLIAGDSELAVGLVAEIVRGVRRA